MNDIFLMFAIIPQLFLPISFFFKFYYFLLIFPELFFLVILLLKSNLIFIYP